MILIVAVVFVAAAGLVYLHFFRSAGDSVSVSVNGEVYAVYALDENRTEDIYTGEDNSGHNRLVILDGKAYMETATCPDGICVAHKPVYRDGESIVCLPNKVVITVTLSEETDTPDIIL